MLEPPPRLPVLPMAEPAPIDEPVPIDPPPPPPPPPPPCAEAELIQMNMATAAQLAIMTLAELGLISNLLSLIFDFMELANGSHSFFIVHCTVCIPSRDFIKNRILRVRIIMPAFGNLSVINTDGSGYNERRAIEEKTPG
jgi:hypothetical protein